MVDIKFATGPVPVASGGLRKGGSYDILIWYIIIQMDSNFGGAKLENTKKKLYDIQKKYLVCALLMIIVGIIFIYLKRMALGIGIIIFGAVFFIGFLVLIGKDGLIEVPCEPKKSKKKKEEDIADVQVLAEKGEPSVDNTEANAEIQESMQAESADAASDFEKTDNLKAKDKIEKENADADKADADKADADKTDSDKADSENADGEEAEASNNKGTKDNAPINNTNEETENEEAVSKETEEADSENAEDNSSDADKEIEKKASDDATDEQNANKADINMCEEKQ